MSSTITLRRAAKLRNRITQHLAELRSKLLRDTSIVVNIYDQSVAAKVTAQSELYNEILTRFMAVSQVLFGLRARIDVVNAECGINALLAEQNQVKGQLSVVQRVVQSEDTTPSDKDIELRLQGVKERNAVATYGSNEMSFSCISDKMVVAAKITAQQFQARLDSIQDQIESLNANRTVEVTPSELALLQSERLI